MLIRSYDNVCNYIIDTDDGVIDEVDANEVIEGVVVHSCIHPPFVYKKLDVCIVENLVYFRGYYYKVEETATIEGFWFVKKFTKVMLEISKSGVRGFLELEDTSLYKRDPMSFSDAVRIVSLS